MDAPRRSPDAELLAEPRALPRQALVQRGARVTALEVYRRALPQVDAAAVAQLETRWRDDGISLVTLTSVETLDNLVALLSAAGRALLRTTPFVTLSERIAAAAHSQGIVGTCVLSRGADDDGVGRRERARRVADHGALRDTIDQSLQCVRHHCLR